MNETNTAKSYGNGDIIVLVLGIASLLVPAVGGILGIIGIVYGFRRKKATALSLAGKIGLILSIAGVLIDIAEIVIFVLLSVES